MAAALRAVTALAMAEVFSPGSAAIIPRPLIRPLQTMPAEATVQAAAIAGEAATGAAEAISAAHPSGREAHFD